MKKNKLMRLASVLLVLTLLTTCVIGGTYAKYITSDSAQDVARVAKFGVVASVSGDLFGPSYSGKTSNKIQTWGEHEATVSASSNSGKPSADVVAPGTVGDTMTFSVKGTPEVSTTTVFGRSLTNAGVDAKQYSAEPVLKAGDDYGVMVKYTGIPTKESIVGKYVTTDKKTFTPVAANAAVQTTEGTEYYDLQDATGALSANYYPITWKTTVSGSAGTGSPTNSLKSAVDAITTELNGKNFTPNTPYTLSATLSWDWFFEGDLTDTDAGSANENSQYSNQDKADTILGDMIAAAADTGKLAGDEYVVAKSGNDYKAINTKSVKVVGSDSVTNEVTVAYINGAAPTGAAYKADILTAADQADNLGENVIAVLGVAFDASLTVKQVD